jgi:hypothetical protein
MLFAMLHPHPSLLAGDPLDTIPALVKGTGASLLVTDFAPLRLGRAWREGVAERVEVPFHEVDAHNVVPCWVASGGWGAAVEGLASRGGGVFVCVERAAVVALSARAPPIRLPTQRHTSTPRKTATHPSRQARVRCAHHPPQDPRQAARVPHRIPGAAASGGDEWFCSRFSLVSPCRWVRWRGGSLRHRHAKASWEAGSSSWALCRRHTCGSRLCAA